MARVLQEAETTITIKDHILFLSTVFFFWFATYIYVPTFSLYLEQRNFSYAAIGIILGSYGVTQVLIRFPLGILSDMLQRIRKQLYIGGFGVAAISGIMFVYLDSFTAILIARLLAGITASMWVMATVIYAQYFLRSQSSRAMGTLQFLTVMPQFISMAIAGFLVQGFGWNLPFWVAVAASLCGMFLALFIKDLPVERTTTEVKPRVADYIKRTLQVPSLISITALSMIGHGILFITIFGFTPLYASRIGVDEGSLFWIVTAFFIPHAIASLGLAFISLKESQIQLILVGSLLVTAGCMFVLPFTQTLITLSMVHAVIGLTLGLFLPLLLGKIASLPVQSIRTSVMGFYQSFYALGIFLGPLIAGAIAQSFGLRETFWFGAILALIAMPLLLKTKVKSTSPA
ncbi:MFS transporter [Alkalicoccobacillus porphyridii]|uniref:MFS transporter n=1 Tax=Alkalicoccobacillus porphyridii TaxID=2597270 RepID=A0A554A0K3_9BACI|nr:MFS transporter [Alkalicoccobacillus porphyridii]TSB47215.1 MFS transporter [Alkalicoccobacillus porphyridii]